MSRCRVECYSCTGGGATNSPRWHWLHRIRWRYYPPFTWFSDMRRASRNRKRPRSPSPDLFYRFNPPGLPTPRPRALTLDSSPYPPNPSETPKILHAASQSSSSFFSRLPLELRILVYGHLFGNRTLHIERKFCYPDARGIKHHNSGYVRATDKSRPEGWYWWHSVCHRDPGIFILWHDNCRNGIGLYCDPRGKDKGSCDLDISWLLTCRQGYSESIAVLYGTNRFYFPRHNHDTIMSLPHTFLPQRLATITAVVMSWDQWKPPKMIYDQPTYTSLWDIISLMTNLRSLHIRLTIAEPGIPDSFEQTERAIEREWFGPPDELVLRLGSQLGEFIFMVPDSLYNALQGLGNEEEVTSGYDESLSCFTRVIGDYKYVINNDWPDFFPG